MSFLIDTNVISEWAKAQPDQGVVAWLGDTDEDRLFVSVVTLAELRHGVERLPRGKRRAQLDDWLTHDLAQRFTGRILAVDESVADRWGRLVARLDGLGRPIGAVDAFLAATADFYGFALVTRNERDFAPTGVPVLNPWTSKGRP